MELKTHRLGLLILLAGACNSLGQDGTKIWGFTTADEVFASPAIGADGTVYIGSMDGKLYAINSDGSKRWEFPTKGGLASSPAIGSDESIYIGSLDARLYCLNAKGVERWEFLTGSQIYCSPAIGIDGTVYVGSMDDKLYALSPAGAAKWVFTTKGEVFSSPAVADDGTIYLGSRDNRIYAVNADGTEKWEYTVGSWVDSSPAIGPAGAVYVGSRDGNIYAFSPDGEKLWEFYIGREVHCSPAVGPDGTIYVGAPDQKLHALNPDGTERWQVATGGRILYSSPAIATDGTIYIGAEDASLYAFGPGGLPKWVFATGASLEYASPTIGRDGTVVVGSNDGKLYALKGTSGPAAGPWPMFRRDSRHTASGFVTRRLPAGYSPGAKTVVSLHAVPPANIAFYAVEDSPPVNWQVGLMSHDGVFDPASRTVRFGPFLDGLERTLTYEVSSPFGESGDKQFSGSSSLAGVERLIGGDQTARLVPLHPADSQVVDGWMTIGEMTAYGAAWKAGASWPIPPSPVPLSYLNQAVILWQQGEQYRYDTNFALAPLWWVNVATNPSPSDLIHSTPSPATSITNGSANADLPPIYAPATPLTVTIAVTPATNVMVYAVEDQPPDGWTVSQTSADGWFDPLRQKVKWGPFFDQVQRALTYQVTPPQGATAAGAFSGTAAFDGAMVQIGGRRQTVPNYAVSGFAERDLPRSYSPGGKMLVQLRVAPPSGITYYEVEDVLPAGWQAGAISDSGFFATETGTVRFGPFLDALPRTLTYEVTPPPGESGIKTFDGTVALDGVISPLGGDLTVDLVPLHPADNTPADGWMTIGELTAYGAAWKQGSPWPSAPSPIPVSFVTQATALWQAGEQYTYSTNYTNAPLWWVNLDTNQPPLDLIHTNAPVATSITNGSANADLPRTYLPATPFTVTITVLPATNVLVYAVEDQAPGGWSVSRFSETGRFDPVQKKVKWGPFFDQTQRTLTYQVTPPRNATGAATFNGVAAFDGATVQISGRREALPGPLATGFAERELPLGYSPGGKLVVAVRITPPTNAIFYVVQDMPPADWVVGAISDNGYFDPVNGQVKFGPFLDGTARTLTYEVTPPLDESGFKLFTGTATIGGTDTLVGGDQSLDLALLHPADNNPVDAWMTIGEMTAYSAAWKRGQTWPLPPNPITVSYLNQARVLWQGGEEYRYDTNIGNAPSWWVNLPAAEFSTNAYPPNFAVAAPSTNSSAVAMMPKLFQPGASFTVTIVVSPASDILAYATEDQPPSGWAVSQIGQGGFYDGYRQKVKWGPFFDSAPRTFTYQLTPPMNAGALGKFYGVAAFDDTALLISGRRETVSGNSVTLPGFGTPSFSPGDGFNLLLNGIAGETYVIETSTDLLEWQALTTLTNLTGQAEFLDVEATNLTQRFYRALWP